MTTAVMTASPSVARAAARPDRASGSGDFTSVLATFVGPQGSDRSASQRAAADSGDARRRGSERERHDAAADAATAPGATHAAEANAVAAQASAAPTSAAPTNSADPSTPTESAPVITPTAGAVVGISAPSTGTVIAGDLAAVGPAGAVAPTDEGAPVGAAVPIDVPVAGEVPVAPAALGGLSTAAVAVGTEAGAVANSAAKAGQAADKASFDQDFMQGDRNLADGVGVGVARGSANSGESTVRAPVTAGGTDVSATPVVDTAGVPSASNSPSSAQPTVVGVSLDPAAGSGLSTGPAPTAAVQPHQVVGATTAAAPLASPAPAAPAAAVVPPTAQQLAMRIVPLRLDGDGVHRLTVHLHPVDLGPVSVVAEIRNGAIQVQLTGSTEAARETLRSAMTDLRRDLQDAGFTSCQLDLRQDAPAGGQPQPRSFGARAAAAMGQPGADTAAGDGAPARGPSQTTGQTHRLDLHV
jgi:flagellar hook-length control protein FliK